MHLIMLTLRIRVSDMDNADNCAADDGYPQAENERKNHLLSKTNGFLYYNGEAIAWLTPAGTRIIRGHECEQGPYQTYQ